MVSMRIMENAERKREDASEWSPAANPAVREMLDHIARQLAEEFVRLMDADDALAQKPGKDGKG